MDTTTTDLLEEEVYALLEGLHENAENSTELLNELAGLFGRLVPSKTDAA